MRSFALWSVALASVAAVACGGGGGSTGTNGVVQLVSVTTTAQTISCGRSNHLANPDSVYVLAHLVNTTASDVTIDSIGSVGTVIRATDQTAVGSGALTYTSLPYHPLPTLLQARTGDVTITVSLPTAGPCASSSAELDYKDVSMSIRVTTGVGQYVSLPFIIHVVYTT